MKKCFFLLSAFIFLMATGLQAQSTLALNGEIISEPNVDGFSINPKAGIYVSKNTDGPIAGVELSVIHKFYNHKRPLVFSVDFYGGGEFEIWNTKSPTEEHYQAYVTVGSYFGEKLVRLYFKGGLGTGWGVNRGKYLRESGWFFITEYYEKKDYFTVGIPLKAGLKFLSFDHVSVGLDLQLFLTSEHHLGMLMLSVEFGRLKPYG